MFVYHAFLTRDLIDIASARLKDKSASRQLFMAVLVCHCRGAAAAAGRAKILEQRTSVRILISVCCAIKPGNKFEKQTMLNGILQGRCECVICFDRAGIIPDV
eukprot:10499576-Karenia_brevis.AAC.1